MKKIPEDSVFIIDSISSAYMLAALRLPHPVKCIYESKDINWRKADFEKLYDLILSDVAIKEKVVLKVPHPFYVQGNSLLSTIRIQKDFVQKIKRICTLPKGHTYYSCSTSSILIANKTHVPHVLVDEGMGAIMLRHGLWSGRKDSVLKPLREFISSFLVPFKFKASTPQLTLSSDQHDSILFHIDYRAFTSRAIEKVAAQMIEKTKEGEKNVLVLVKGPSHLDRSHVQEGWRDDGLYTDFNLKQIRLFIEQQKLATGTQFFLKTHPSLGQCREFIKGIIGGLGDLGFAGFSVNELIDFEESSSIPAEALLKYGQFHMLLSLDASSSLWNVAHQGEISCYSPLQAIIDFAGIEKSPHTQVYQAQYKLNDLLGNRVNFY